MSTQHRFISTYVRLIFSIFLTISTFFVNCKKGEGDLEWSVELEGDITSPPAVSNDGTVYVGCTDNNLYAISADGEIKWTFQTGGEVFSPAIGGDGTIYIGARDNCLYAINSDGNKKWSLQLGGSSSPAIGGDGTIYVRSSPYSIAAITPDGTKKWESLISSIYGGVRHPIVGSDGTIYAGGYDVLIAAIEPDSGKIKWATGGGDCVDCAIGANGHIYVITYSILPPYDELYELEPDSGRVLRWLEFGLTAPIIGNTSIYCWGPENTLFDIPISGLTANGIFVNSRGNLYPPAILSSGNLAVAAGDTFFIISPSGEIRHRLYTEVNISTAPVIGPDGTIYFGAGKKLYAVLGEGSYPTNAPWPMYRCDNCHTGRAK